MASPCEVLLDHTDKERAIAIGDAVATEAWRIEDKYSRYKSDSVCGQLNANAGQQCAIDQETFQLLQFAQQCYDISEGLFDITSGILRKAWHFDGSENIPTQTSIDSLMPLIGWQRVTFNSEQYKMLAGMEIDFGGIGKEYAVDKALMLARELTDAPMLINFGGDIAVSGPRAENTPWIIGIEHPSFDEAHVVYVKITHGAIATSGDAKRFLQVGNKRYGHVLNVKTGWPVENPPSSITIAAPKCVQAGILATLALLQGENAESYLAMADIQHWIIK